MHFSWADRAARLALHLTILFVTLTGTRHFLAWDPHREGGLIAALMCGLFGAVMQARLAEDGSNRRIWLALLGAGLGPWAIGVAFGPPGPLLPGAWRGTWVVVASTLAGFAVTGARRLFALERERRDEWRLALLVGVAVACFRPYLTSDFFGGIDARSYAYGMADAVLQARAGVFPVLVGQSEFMFEGVIHPIRTAPYHHYLGLALDGLTFRVLSPVGIEHLTVVVTVILGALLCYFCLVRLAPSARWRATGAAILYVSGPAVAGFIYGQEMYMTFMAFAWLPLAVFANLWIIRHDDCRGWALLAASLALVWVCHAPVGLWLTFATLALQGLRLATAGGRAEWKRAAGGGVLFFALSGGYFYSVGEIAGLGGHARPGLAAFLPLLTALAVASAVLAWRRRALAKRREPVRRLPEILVLLLVLAGTIAGLVHPVLRDHEAQDIVRRLFPGNLQPVSATATRLEDLQLGLALWLAFLAGVTALFLTDRLELRLLVLVGLGGVALIVPVPGLTDFLIAHVPSAVIAVSSISLWLRYLPTLVTGFVFVGFLGMLAWEQRHPASRRVLGVLLCAAVCWSLGENAKYVRSAGRAKESTGEHLDPFRPENVTEFAYIFPGMPTSPYLVNGVADYHLESHLLAWDDPTRDITPPLPGAAKDWQVLKARPDERNPAFLNLSPSFLLAPGERVLMRFRFQDRVYRGVLVMRGPGSWYREYRLPEAGFGPKSFGTDPARPKTVALWNSSDQPQPVNFVFIRGGSTAAETAPPDFAEVSLQSYDPATLPIRTLKLVPYYRAMLTVAQPAYLESIRAFIPGYAATVNGHPQPVLPSPNHRVMIPLSAGDNLVALKYVGTAGLWTALAVSGLAWLGLLAWAGRQWVRRVS